MLVMCCRIFQRKKAFLQKLQVELGDNYGDFNALANLGKAFFIIENELWEQIFASRLDCVKEFIVDIWEECKSKLYGDSQCTQQPCPQSPAGDLGNVAGVMGPKGKCRCQEGKPGTGDCIMLCLSGSALNTGCMVNGMNAMAAC